jgi:hypothetical protein
MIGTTAAAALVGFGLIAAGAAVGAPAVSAAPAAVQGPLPAFTFTSHLEALLVKPRQLTTITGAENSMRALATVTDLNDGDPGLTPAQCGGAVEPLGAVDTPAADTPG